MIRWHALFDDCPEIVAHVCDAHRAELLEIPCDQCHAEGTDCPRVRHTPCECGDWPDCDPCRSWSSLRELVA